MGSAVSPGGKAEAAVSERNRQGPTLFLLHALGASAREWDAVTAVLGPDFDCVALDLPGFGDNTVDADFDVTSMLDWLADCICARDARAWMVVGHSMGGKLATLLASRAERGERGLSGLCGVVLLAASPPSPEPMEEDRRAQMLGWSEQGAISRADAETFVSANIAGPLPSFAHEQAVADVMRVSPIAWRAWLERGSRENWLEHVGDLNTPALIIAGAQDGDLGEAAQTSLNMRHYKCSHMATVADAAHLLPYERPDAVAALIAQHWRDCAKNSLPQDAARLLASDRVSARTRGVLMARRLPPSPQAPSCLSERQRETLAAVIARLLPDTGAQDVLPRHLDAALASGRGDGWRFAELPPDREAWPLALDALEGFTACSPTEQEAWLNRMALGGAESDTLSASQMMRWFEDARAMAVQMWVSLPQTMARIGYDGFANGGDGTRLQGYVLLGADEAETWNLAARKAHS